MSVINITSQQQYDILTKVSAIVGALGTRKLITYAWKSVTKKEPPKNPAAPTVLWKEALLWGAVTGLTVGIMRVVSRRVTTSYWEKFKGSKPRHV